MESEHEVRICEFISLLGIIREGHFGFFPKNLNELGCGRFVRGTVEGFDHGKIPYLINAQRKMSNYPLSDLNEQEINVLLNGENIISLLDCPTLCPFRPPEGWAGHIEKMEKSSRFQRERVDKNC